MWNTLRLVHEGNSAGTPMYWLKKLVTFKIEGENINTKLNRLEVLSKQLSSLVLSKQPLTVDEITCMVVCLSLPAPFTPITASLLQRDFITSSVLLSAVQEELTQHHLHVTNMCPAPVRRERTTVLLVCSATTVVRQVIKRTNACVLK